MSRARHSFDVFDTCLTRTFARPDELFFRLGQRQGANSPAAWMRSRIAAEQAARRRTKSEEVTLEDIYRVLAASMGWSDAHLRQAMAAELELEAESLRPVPEIRARISRVHRAGQPVVFITDTYLPESFLRGLLERHGLWQAGDRLYASSTEGVTKRSGNLFRVVLDRERLGPGELCHAGDDGISDGSSARRAGLVPEPFTATCLNRHEQAIAEQAGTDLLLRSRLAAASRLARLSQIGEISEEARTLWDVGASAIGPMLTGYVAWCLREAVRRGIRRLYFVSRDGQVLLRIAETLCRNWKLDVECRYLLGSRQAWHLPSLTEFNARDIDWMFAPGLSLSVAAVLQRVGLDPALASPVLVENGFMPEDRHHPLDPARCARLQELLLREPLRAMILAAADTRRQTAAGYLRQEGLMDSIDWALVDMGWSGRMQRSLGSLLGGLGLARPFSGFYFALNGSPPSGAGDRMHSYLDPDEFARSGLRYIPVLETITAADHASVCGYRQEVDGRFVPIFHSRSLEARNIPWVRLQQGGTVAFAEEFSRLVSAGEAAEGGFRPVAALLMAQFFGAPTREEARAYRLFRAGEDQAGGRLHRLAVPIAPGHYWAALLRGGRPLYRLRWPEACIAGALNHPRIRIALLHVRQALGAWRKRTGWKA